MKFIRTASGNYFVSSEVIKTLTVDEVAIGEELAWRVLAYTKNPGVEFILSANVNYDAAVRLLNVLANQLSDGDGAIDLFGYDDMEDI